MSEDTPRAGDVVDGVLQGSAFVVTEEDLKENPVLAEAGIQVGDVGSEATPEQAAELDAKSTEVAAEEVAAAEEDSTPSEVTSE